MILSECVGVAEEDNSVSVSIPRGEWSTKPRGSMKKAKTHNLMALRVCRRATRATSSRTPGWGAPGLQVQSKNVKGHAKAALRGYMGRVNPGPLHCGRRLRVLLLLWRLLSGFISPLSSSSSLFMLSTVKGDAHARGIASSTPLRLPPFEQDEEGWPMEALTLVSIGEGHSRTGSSRASHILLMQGLFRVAFSRASCSLGM